MRSGWRPVRPPAFGGLLGGLLGDPRKRFASHVGQQQQVLKSVGIGRFPLFIGRVLVGTLERGVVARAFFGVVFPDRGAQAIDADFVCGFVGGSFCRFIFAHFIFFR